MRLKWNEVARNHRRLEKADFVAVAPTNEPGLSGDKRIFLSCTSESHWLMSKLFVFVLSPSSSRFLTFKVDTVWCLSLVMRARVFFLAYAPSCLLFLLYRYNLHEMESPQSAMALDYRRTLIKRHVCRRGRTNSISHQCLAHMGCFPEMCTFNHTDVYTRTESMLCWLLPHPYAHYSQRQRKWHQ